MEKKEQEPFLTISGTSQRAAAINILFQKGYKAKVLCMTPSKKPLFCYHAKDSSGTVLDELEVAVSKPCYH